VPKKEFNAAFKRTKGKGPLVNPNGGRKMSKNAQGKRKGSRRLGAASGGEKKEEIFKKEIPGFPAL